MVEVKAIDKFKQMELEYIKKSEKFYSTNGTKPLPSPSPPSV